MSVGLRLLRPERRPQPPVNAAAPNRSQSQSIFLRDQTYSSPNSPRLSATRLASTGKPNNVRYIGSVPQREPFFPYPIDHGIRSLIGPGLKPAGGIRRIASQETPPRSSRTTRRVCLRCETGSVVPRSILPTICQSPTRSSRDSTTNASTIRCTSDSVGSFTARRGWFEANKASGGIGHAGRSK